MKKPLAHLTEKHVTEQVIGWLKAHRFYCVRLNSGLISTPDGRRLRVGERGLPDWIIIRGLRFFFMELKRPGKTLSPDQENWFAWATREGIPAIWADGLGMFLAKLEALAL
jgi:hypothetical protein